MGGRSDPPVGLYRSQLPTLAEIARWLGQRPLLHARISPRLDLVENVRGNLKRADAAERPAIEELRALGQ